MTPTAQSQPDIEALRKQKRKVQRILRKLEQSIPDNWGGSNRKSTEDHKAEGTWRSDRHGLDYSLSDFCKKIKPRSADECRADTEARVITASDQYAVDHGCYFDMQQARYVEEWFPKFLKHSKGKWSGEPFHLLNWQVEHVIHPLFGWLKADGTRRFRRTYVEVPKKNGKSTLAAGVGLFMLVGDGEAGSHVFSAASDREQASLVHNEAISMVNASELVQYLKVNNSTKHIYNQHDRLVYKAISSKASHQEGHDGHCCIVDELHVWYGDQLWDALKYMGRARSQPLIFVITTAGDDWESQCRKQHEYAQSVVSGDIIDDRLLVYITGATKDDDLTDPEVWRKANPSMGVTINEDDFGADVQEGMKNQRSTASMKRYSFNIWNTSQSRWLNTEEWELCEADFPTDGPCWLGLDLARKCDTSSAVLVFPLDDGKFGQLPFFWLPEDRATELSHVASFRDWAAEDMITLTSGDVADFNVIEQDIVELCQTYDVRQMLFDPKYAEEITQRISDETGVERVSFAQTLMTYTGPATTYERLLAEHKLLHPGNNLLTWQASHVDVYSDTNDNIRPTKPKHGYHKTIDGIVSGIMALAGALRGEGEVSVYDNRGIVTL